jgi:hypothetical protein
MALRSRKRIRLSGHPETPAFAFVAPVATNTAGPPGVTHIVVPPAATHTMVPSIAANMPRCIRCSTGGGVATDCLAVGPDLICIWCGFAGHLQLLYHPAITRVAARIRTIGAQRTMGEGEMVEE